MKKPVQSTGFFMVREMFERSLKPLEDYFIM